MSFTPVYRGHLTRIVVGVLLIAWLLADHVSHAASSPETAEKVNRLIDVSGLRHTARQVLPGMAGSFDDPSQKIPGNVRAALRDAAAQAFQPDPMIERIRARLGATLTARQLDETLAWLDSPLGRRITAMENEAAEPAAVPRIQGYARELERRPPGKRRADLIRELNLATGAGEFNALMMEATLLATALGLNAAQPVQQQLPSDVMRQRVRSSLPQLREQTDQVVILAMFYTYRPLSDQELGSYLKFLKSPSGAAYSKGAIAGFGDAMLEANGRFMQAIPKAVAKHKGMTGT
jgi:hypothetical protein